MIPHVRTEGEGARLRAAEARANANRMSGILAGPHAKTLVGDIVVVEPLKFFAAPVALEKCTVCRRWPDMVPNCGFRGCPHK